MNVVPVPALLTEARRSFHAALFHAEILSTNDDGIPSIADKDSRSSIAIAQGITRRLGNTSVGARLAGQMAGKMFEVVVSEYLEETLPKLATLRPGSFQFKRGLAIAETEQYAHLLSLSQAAKTSPELAIAIGMDYLIKPDVTVLRLPEPDGTINSQASIVDEDAAKFASLRLANNISPILHASVSCKWTLRSDRAQNARSEALNLVRNRKGRSPHIVVVTAEPMPGRISSLAYGTGDIDCVYHIALPELVEAVDETHYDDSKDTLKTMIDGKRLRDISDLPLDLAI